MHSLFYLLHNKGSSEETVREENCHGSTYLTFYDFLIRYIEFLIKEVNRRKDIKRLKVLIFAIIVITAPFSSLLLKTATQEVVFLLETATQLVCYSIICSIICF